MCAGGDDRLDEIPDAGPDALGDGDLLRQLSSA